MKLIPYIRSLAVEARNTGMPITRPLFLVYPDQKEAWIDWQSYLLGPDILVSAVWQSGKEKHKLYLPAGEKWVDAWDPNTFYDGGQEITVDTPLYKLPIFVKRDADVIKEFQGLKELYEESLELAKNRPDLKELEKAAAW